MIQEFSVKRGISNKQRQAFYQELGMLLSSSIDILTALEIMAEEEKIKEIRKATNNIILSLKKGEPFTSGISKAFNLSRYETATIHSGESTGKLGHVLIGLAGHFRNKNEAGRQLISLLAYPVIVLATSTGILYFMMAYMVPMFSDSFKRMNSELPYITRAVIKSADIIKATVPIVVIVFAIAGAILIWIARDSKNRKVMSDFIFSIPFLKKVIVNIELNRFYIMMSTLTSARVQLTEAIRLSADAAFFPSFGSRLLTIENQILNGVPFYKALKESRLFPLKVVSLSRMAEETNTLDLMFHELMLQHQQHAKHKQELIKAIAEPVLILVMGLITGVIVISMYLPIFQMSMVGG